MTIERYASLEELIPYIGKDVEKQVSILVSKGLTQKIALTFVQFLEEDWNLCNSISFEDKVKVMSRGFFPSRLKLYGLDEVNYVEYLSDLDYYRLHPLNNHFAIWINDKVTLKYMIPSVFHTLEGRHLSVMPEYYLYIENDGKYSYMMDSPKYIAHDEDYLFHLLQEKKILALKPSRGQGGYGFVKLEYAGGDVYINGVKKNKQEFNQFRDTLFGYIVTEYATQHKDLDAVCKDSVCTLRVIAVKNQSNKYAHGETDIIASYARFGTSKSHGASNLSSGGVGIPYDFNTGRFGKYFYRYLKYSEGEDFKFDRHPDSKISLEGKILPHWEFVRDIVYSVCYYLSSLEYFGFDLMITDGGVKICEINTLPAQDDAQVMCGPFWKNSAARTYFELKLKL